MLSDRDVDAAHAAIPSLLAVSAVHHHLISVGKRVQTALIVDVYKRQGLEFAVVAVQCLFHLAEVWDTFVYRTVTRLFAGDIEECFWISHDEQIKKLKN